MTLAPYKLESLATLPESLTDGLKARQVKALEETVFKINQGFGCLLKDTCRLLYRLKQDIPHGHFTAFLKSGLIPISPRSARDLIAAHDWIMETCVDERTLAQLGFRALRRISVAPPAIQQSVEESLVKGEKVTEQFVSKLVDSKPAKTDKEEDLRLYDFNWVTRLEEQVETLEQENLRLQTKVKELQSMLKGSAVSV